MSKKTETSSPEARLPKGLFDTSAGEIRATEEMLGTARGVFESYGFEPLDTPSIEFSDALGKFLPDQDRPNEGVFSFQDDDEQWLSLRYDLTAPLARYVAENYQTLPKPFRRYQSGPVWRNEKPGPGRYRQFKQFDADTVGASSVAADAELCMLAADTLEAFGVPRGQYVVKVNNRKVLDGVLESIGLGGDANKGKRLTVLRAIDKYDRLGEEGVRFLLGKGRKDESGDFTKGAKLTLDQSKLIIDYIRTQQFTPLEYVGSNAADVVDDRGKIQQFETTEGKPAGLFRLNNEVTIQNLRKTLGSVPVAATGIDELEGIAKLTHAAGYDEERIVIDSSVVRGLEYYTGPVFEAELTAPITDDKGQPIRLGSVVSGGRYDRLVERFTGEKVPATGVSIGVSRLLFGLQRLGRYKDSAPQGPVVVLVLDRDRIAGYQKMAQGLRTAGIRAEMYLGDAGMKAQMKYADKRHAPCVVIQGGDEKAKGEVQIKDLILGAALTSIENREEYLKKQAEAQFAVPEADLVREVRRVLDRHKS
ncbi:MAG TPA: histidine--tRNA ligase [Methyloceanibacter sp.]|nr:histidine--tRNA ligase [Methyloceanibacter sp.]